MKEGSARFAVGLRVYFRTNSENSHETTFLGRDKKAVPAEQLKRLDRAKQAEQAHDGAFIKTMVEQLHIGSDPVESIRDLNAAINKPGVLEGFQQRIKR